MIAIKPLREKDKLIEFYKKANIKMNENSIAVVAADGDEILGVCLFDMLDKELLIHHLEPINEVMLADGILRSALHVGVENGKMKAFYSDSAPKTLFKSLGFIKDEETNELDVQLLFSSCGSCGK